jgi:hypothetical protein
MITPDEFRLKFSFFSKPELYQFYDFMLLCQCSLVDTGIECLVKRELTKTNKRLKTKMAGSSLKFTITWYEAHVITYCFGLVGVPKNLILAQVAYGRIHAALPSDFFGISSS